MVSFLGKLIIGVGIVVIIMPLAIDIFGLPGIGLPDEIYHMLVDNVAQLFAQMNYFFPISFVLLCLSTVFITKHASIVFNMISWVIRKVTGQ